jgi:hypothetical protein
MYSKIYIGSTERFLLLVQIGTAVSQENVDEQLEKKYAAILGDCEFDLTDLGGETQVLNYYIHDGKLWVDSGDGRPAVMEPGKDEEFKFAANDPESGHFEITFLKDDEGKYSICRIYIENANLEITGFKIGGESNRSSR